MAAKMPTAEELVERYYALCDRRDAAYAKAAPLEAELDKVNAERCKLHERADELAGKIEDTWAAASDDGTREGWLALKREIADIAAFLRKIPPRPAKPAEKKA